MDPEERSLYLTLLVSGAVVFLMAVFFLLNIIRYQKKRRALSQEEFEAELRLFEEDRARVAAELHDGLGTALSAVKLRLQALGPASAQELQAVEEAESSLDHVQYLLRRTPARHAPQFVLQRGLQAALEEFLGSLRQGPCRFFYTLDVPPVTGEMALQVYRLVQEAVHNILRHAAATEAEVQLTRSSNGLRLLVRDNGRGFDREHLPQAGIGLRNMRARADALAAKATLDTAPGKGTVLTFDIPLSHG
ncbi:MAG TPA: ATP-binding protein [Chitinophagaceae bacterium]|nr:ATP-binding protein [Chitinophagaceae bacterium]